jgi:protocatechuate 3,4-dioxygenase, beta subunit
MFRSGLPAAIIFFVPLLGCFTLQALAQQADRIVGGRCEDCGLMFQNMPKSLTSSATITTREEPGDPIEISGTVYMLDGKTPARGIVLYVYQTDKTGIYRRHGKDGTAHGELRGWMKTDELGRYSFRSIRPGSYPNSDNPQHIHIIIKEPGIAPYWIDEYHFKDDPLLTTAVTKRFEQRGGSGIITLVNNGKGVWKGKRDIVLGQNVPGY